MYVCGCINMPVARQSLECVLINVLMVLINCKINTCGWHLAFPMQSERERERERGGRCGGEESERDVCMGVIELSLIHLLFSVVKTLCCLLALCFFDYYFSKYIYIFWRNPSPFSPFTLCFFIKFCFSFHFASISEP